MMSSLKDGKKPIAEFRCCNCKFYWKSKSYKQICPKCGHLYVSWQNAEECLEIVRSPLKFKFRKHKF